MSLEYTLPPLIEIEYDKGLKGKYKRAAASLKGKRIYALLQQISVWLNSDVDLADALELIYPIVSKRGKKPNTAEARAVSYWYTLLKDGRNTSVAFEGWLSPTEHALIGTSSSRELALAIENVVENAERISKIKTALKQAVTRPLLNIAMVIILIFVVDQKLLPAIDGLVERSDWPQVSLALEAFTDAMFHAGPYILLLLLVTVVASLVALPRYTGPGRRFIDYMPFFNIYRFITGVNYLLAMRSLMVTNANPDEALRKLGGFGSPYMKHRVETLLNLMLNGLSYAEATYNSGHDFPDANVNDMMAGYVRGRNLVEGFDVVTRNWLSQQDKFVASLTKGLSVSSTLLFFGLLSFVLAGVGALIIQVTQGGPGF